MDDGMAFCLRGDVICYKRCSAGGAPFQIGMSSWVKGGHPAIIEFDVCAPGFSECCRRLNAIDITQRARGQRATAASAVLA
jgi:hypothetical protein